MSLHESPDGTRLLGNHTGDDYTEQLNEAVQRILNEPRMIDLDLIDCFGLILNKKNIILPHPRAHLRRFVMEPLLEINPNWHHPIYNIKVSEILKNLSSQNIQVFDKIMN